MRILSPGDAASGPSPSATMSPYRDPLTGIAYVANNYGTEIVNPSIGFPVAKTIGARMLQRASYRAKIVYHVSQPPDPRQAS